MRISASALALLLMLSMMLLLQQCFILCGSTSLLIWLAVKCKGKVYLFISEEVMRSRSES